MDMEKENGMHKYMCGECVKVMKCFTHHVWRKHVGTHTLIEREALQKDFKSLHCIVVENRSNARYDCVCVMTTIKTKKKENEKNPDIK